MMQLSKVLVVQYLQKGRAVVSPDPCEHSVLAHGHFADDSDLAQVHVEDDLAANQITAVRVGDGEGIAALAIASGEVPFEAHARQLIRTLDRRERL